MKENKVFKKLCCSGKIYKAKGVDSSVFMVWQVTEKHKGVTVIKLTLFGLNIYRKDGKKKKKKIYWSHLQIPRLRFRNGGLLERNVIWII